MPTVSVLSFHADYGCKNRGRCCSSGWPITVEGAERTRLEEAIDSGLLEGNVARPGHVARPGLEGRDSPPTGPALLASIHGRCVFHDDNPHGGCRIHRALGHSAIPLACRQFPRQSVRDPRGVSVTLSHYCPTAQELLIASAAPVTIVINASSFPPDAEYVGLTADQVLPPLLHSRLAMDWESWWLFEELSVALLCEAPAPLRRLAQAVEFARDWTVDRGPLLAHVRESFTRARQAPLLDPALPHSTIAERNADALAGVPEEWRGVASETLWTPSADEVGEDVTRRFLAAHAFANWTAYQGEGLRTWFRSVETAACLLKQTGDPGGADLVLRHLADHSALVERWNDAEQWSAL